MYASLKDLNFRFESDLKNGFIENVAKYYPTGVYILNSAITLKASSNNVEIEEDIAKETFDPLLHETNNLKKILLKAEQQIASCKNVFIKEDVAMFSIN